MIQNLENTLKAGAVPQAPQFRTSALASSNQATAAASKPANGATYQSTKTKDEGAARKSDTEQIKAKTVSSSSGAGDAVAGDPLGDARSKVQEEISSEFAAIMATGTLHASEAAALATRRVMQRHGHVSTAQS